MQSPEPIRRMLYLIGQPGAGKTTLLTTALSDLGAKTMNEPLKHTIYLTGSGAFKVMTGIQLGIAREAFGGTDTLPMNVQPRAVEWLTSRSFPYSYVVAEGDRLGNGTFWSALRSSGNEVRWQVDVLYLYTPDEIAAMRRQQRGSKQNETWVRGRVTKVQNLAADYCTLKPGTILDGTLPMEALVKLLRMHPVLRGLRGDTLQ